MSENQRRIAPKKRGRKTVLFLEYYQLYIFLLPAVIYYLLFHYMPMYGITLAFRDYRFDKGMFFSPWIGVRYFESFFNYFNFWAIIRNTLTINFFKLIVYFPLPIIFALLLNEIKQNKFKQTIQTISYLPYFISWVVTFVIIQQFLALDDGIINQIRVSMGLDKIFFLNEKSFFYPIMFLSFTWKNIGYNAIIYLASLSGIDPSLYEAARIDGAGRLRQMWHISLPGISLTAAMLFILALGSALNAGWDQIYQLRSPGNMQISDILDTYVIQMGLREGQFGYATAVSLFQSVIGLLLIILTNAASKKLTNSEISLF